MKLTINNFFKKNLFEKSLLYTTTGVLIIFITLLGYIYLSAIKSEEEKIGHLINSNKEDIFNSLILEEYDSAEKNLNILTRNYSFDGIEVFYKGKTIKSETNEALLGNLLKKLYGTQFKKTIFNDFGTVSFNIKFSYYTKIFFESVLPFLKVFFILVSFLSFSFWVFYRKHKQMIESFVVVPLSRLGDCIERENYDVDGKDLDKIHEVSVLFKSIEKFRDMKYAQVHSEVANQFAHDIKTPLNAIKRIIDLDPYFRTEAMDYLKISLDRIESVSRDLLLMKKHRENASLVEINPDELITKIYNEFRIANSVADDFLTFKKSRKFTFSSYIEVSVFERIVSNIICNAWEATKAKSTPRLAVSVNIRDKNAEFVFLDNGEGISDVNIKNVFSCGFSTKIHGNGLGLSSAKKYLISVGGDIIVDSEPSIFTKISILIPVSSVFNEELDNKNRKLILIDDDKYNHIPIKKYCERNMIDFVSYTNLSEFFFEASSYSAKSIILLDSYLSNGVRGELSANEMNSIGFKNIYLYSSANFDNISAEQLKPIKGVIEKSDIEKIDFIVQQSWI